MREAISESVAALEELARDGTEGVATKAEVPFSTLARTLTLNLMGTLRSARCSWRTGLFSRPWLVGSGKWPTTTTRCKRRRLRYPIQLHFLNPFLELLSSVLYNPDILIEKVNQLKEALQRSQAEMGRLDSRSNYLANQNASMLTDGLEVALQSEERSTRELAQRLSNERGKKLQLETELLKAEQIVSQLLQEEIKTGGALAKVIKAVR